MKKLKIKHLLVSLLVSYAVVLAVNLTANYRYYASGHDWVFSVSFCVVVTTLGWAGFVFVVRPIISFMANWKKYPVAGFAIAVLLSGAFGVLLMLAVMKGMTWVHIWREQSIDEYVNNSIYAALFSILIGLIFTGYEFLQRWKKSLEDNERMKADMIRTQYEALKNQVNPHFLFNSLNTLAAIIPEKPGVAVDFVQQLSKVFRYSLQDAGEQTAPLAEEIKIVSSYLFLNVQRFDGKLQTNFDIAPGAAALRIVPQCVLMLVENAIKHNEISESKPLDISIYTTGGMLVVKNNLQRKRIPEPSTGIGLENIRRRYALLTSHVVEITEENNYFIVKIPLL